LCRHITVPVPFAAGRFLEYVKLRATYVEVFEANNLDAHLIHGKETNRSPRTATSGHDTKAEATVLEFSREPGHFRALRSSATAQCADLIKLWMPLGKTKKADNTTGSDVDNIIGY
jgi:hypothetical protein